MGYCFEFRWIRLTLGKICLCLQWDIALNDTEYDTFYRVTSPFPAGHRWDIAFISMGHRPHP